MEVPHQAVSDEGSSKSRNLKRRRIQPNIDQQLTKRSKPSPALPSTVADSPQWSEPLTPRRSSRLQEKQQTKEDVDKIIQKVSLGDEQKSTFRDGYNGVLVRRSPRLHSSSSVCSVTPEEQPTTNGRKRRRTSSHSPPPPQKSAKVKTSLGPLSPNKARKARGTLSGFESDNPIPPIPTRKGGAKSQSSTHGGTESTKSSRKKRSKDTSQSDSDSQHIAKKGGKSKAKPSHDSLPNRGRDLSPNKKRRNLDDSTSPLRKPRSKSKAKNSTVKGKGKAWDSSDSESTFSAGKGKSLRKKRFRKDTGGRDSKGKGKSKGSPLSKEGTSSLRHTENHFSLPTFAEFARLTMASEDSKVPKTPIGDHDDTSNMPNEAGGSGSSGGTSQAGAEGEPKPFDPFPSMNEESRRLQSMLEARGLPPHLLGALGSKMQYLLQKSMSSSMSSSNNSRAHELLAGVEAMEDETMQLQSCIEMGQLLVMGNEDTLSGFPVKQAVPALIKLLSMEHNFDMMLNACRALTYMMEALPRSTVVVVEAVPLLIEKLQVIQCMDVAEQALSALELLSRRHGRAILQAGGLNACLLYLDFFSIAPQRSALSVAANCCHSVMENDFPLVTNAIPILTNKLQHQDKRSVESCCQSFSRLVDNFSNNPDILQIIASHGLLPNLQQLLVISPPVVSSSVFVMVLRLLSTLCGTCPTLAVNLLKLNMADTLRYLLVGPGEITLENIELTARTPNEVYEILLLASEMVPPLPKEGILEVEEIMNTRRHSPSTVQWEWQDNGGSWRPYGKLENRIIEATHHANEEECSITILGNGYSINLGDMQQMNEDTVTTRSIRRTIIEPVKVTAEQHQEEDARAVALSADPSLGSNYIQALFAVLYEVFNSMAGSTVRNKCLKTILRILYHAKAETLVEILKDIAVSSHIAMMLKSSDFRTVVGAMQMADILMQKLPDIFTPHFHREGVMHQMKNLRDSPLKMLATPKPEVTTPPMPRPPVVGSPQTPTTTRKRLSDMFRKGRNQFRIRRRGRSEEELTARSQTPPFPPPWGAEGKSPSSGGVIVVGGAGRLPEGSGSPPVLTAKERVQEWIQKQASVFMERWGRHESSDQNPAVEIVKRLGEVGQQLDIQSPACIDALKAMCEILLDPTTNVSAFEFMHCDLHTKLMSYLIDSNPDCAIPRNTRLRHFLHIFMGLPDPEASPLVLVEWTPPQQVGLVPLLHMLHKSVGQLEQFPVKVHDLPGRRGSQALRFFNTHQIKCSLERHPSAVHTSQWKGGPLRIDPLATIQWKGGPLKIDPLATIQTLERYMIMRGFGRQDHGSRRFMEEFDMSEESEIDDAMLVGFQGISDRHYMEFLINDNVLPFNMTIFQAIKQYSLGSVFDGEEDTMPLGRPEIWIRAHTIQYRTLPSSPGGDGGKAGPSKGLTSSLPSTPITEMPSGRKPPWSSGVSGRRRTTGSSKVPSGSSSGITPRVTRSSREKPVQPLPGPLFSPASPHGQPKPLPERPLREKEKVRLSPLQQTLQQCVSTELAPGDPSSPVLRLLKVLDALNTHWTDLYQGLAGNPIVPVVEFVNNKLAAKATRQVQDPLNVMTGNFPQWLKDLTKTCPFLFPFECRQMLFYLTTFDRDRAIARLQEQQPELSTSEASQTVTPRFDKKKRRVSRENLLEQAEKMMNDLANSRALLEISYEDEVGTGLGPTLEFYTLVSREVQRSDLGMWRGDPCPLPGAPQGASSTPLYISTPVGLFPTPMGPSTKFSVVEEVCSKFRFLGKFVAKAIMDSRMLDLPLSEAFYKWILGLEGLFTAQDLQFVDPVIARSFAQLAAVAVKKHVLESDPLLSGKALAVGIDSLTLDGGGTIEDLDLDFTLPGYPDVELKPGGKDIPVTVHNLDDYLKLVVDWTLVRGVGRQMEAFKEGFNSVISISSLQSFYPSEMDLLLCGAHHQKWDIKELMEHCRPDHGYSHDSRAVQYLFEVLSTYDTSEQRQFVQFVTGSPRLPVGGFRALNPQLTIVRKTVELSQNPDNFLPSVMTCVNYLKLPDYSSVEVMRERLYFALLEGKFSFHLS